MTPLAHADATVVEPFVCAVVPQTLMIDADDTLWENNILFERAIDQFIEIVNHPELSPAEVRAAFDRIEAKRVKVHGYGTHAFQQSLIVGFEYLTGARCTADDTERLEACAAGIRESELELMDGVEEILPLLAARHTLVLVTKGDHAEQTAKLLQSGLAHHFDHVEVLREKHAAAYVEICERYGCDRSSAWMIGNSPRSDVNPALQAGLHAVYLPHPSTWILEQEPIGNAQEGRTLLHLSSFRELALHF
jgi:putative hydrolase of the HAD superfamily